MDIGTRIRQLRTQRQLSQEALAQQLDISRQAIAKWENGSALPSTVHLLALCEVFGVPLSELTGGGELPVSKPRLIENPWLRWGLLATGVLLGVLAALWGVLSGPVLPEGAIGYADGPTSIWVQGTSLPNILLGVLAGLLVIGALLLFWYSAKKRKS